MFNLAVDGHLYWSPYGLDLVNTYGLDSVGFNIINVLFYIQFLYDHALVLTSSAALRKAARL